MLLSLAGAIVAALCYGVATVLQAVAARSAPSEDGVHPRLLLRLALRPPFVAGIGLDVVGIGAALSALRHLPLFVVQATVASSLAVTAVVASRVLRIRLSRSEWLAAGAVCAGLALLAVSAGRENPVTEGAGFKAGLLAAVAVLGVAGFLAGRLSGLARSVVLGTVAGLGYGAVGIAVRTITSLAPGDLVRDPALYVVPAGGLMALLCFTTALQHGSVTVPTAATVVAETVAPAAVGVWLLHDSTRPGFAPVAATGFVVAILGALALARFGQLAGSDDRSEPAQLAAPLPAPADRATP